MIRKETFEVITKECMYRHEDECWGAGPSCDCIKCSYDICPLLKYRKENTEKVAVLSPEEFADKLLRIYNDCWVKDGDEEEVHYHMDAAICELFQSLGYEEAVYIFDNTPKWYA